MSCTGLVDNFRQTDNIYYQVLAVGVVECGWSITWRAMTDALDVHGGFVCCCVVATQGRTCTAMKIQGCLNFAVPCVMGVVF